MQSAIAQPLSTCNKQCTFGFVAHSNHSFNLTLRNNTFTYKLTTIKKLLEEHIAQPTETPIRLQDYGVGIFYNASTKSALKKAIKKGLVMVNNKRAQTGTFISANDCIQLFGNTEQEHKQFIKELTVLFEDDYLAVIHKPAGLLVSGNSFATVANCLEQNLTKSTLKDVCKPKRVHRLDYPTTGALLVGKTASSVIALNRLFEQKQITKQYYAVTIGKMPQQGTINQPVDDKPSITHYEVIKTLESEKYDCLNLVKVNLDTGRRHQIRKHFHSIGNPIFGDKQYFIEGKVHKGYGLYLHSFSLEFIHPFKDSSILVEAPLPKKFTRLFEL